VTNFSPRPDLAEFYPGQSDFSKAGFAEFVHSRPGEKVFFTVETDIGSYTIPVQIPKLALPSQELEMDEHFLTLVNEVNERGLTVLEIGARVVGEESFNLRRYFSGARRYIGMDIHPAPTVDVVGDVHFLSQAVGTASVDAIFSMAVLEHLSHPWLAAKEINRALTVGGLVFFHTVHTWPIHEQPNDFWRFSDEGLKVLFGPDTGFDVLHASVSYPFYIYPDYRQGPYAQVPLNPGFGVAKILSRKVHDLEPDAVVWPVRHRDSQERSSQYPYRENREPTKHPPWERKPL
jgi:SAM-dependent methyltransferase